MSLNLVVRADVIDIQGDVPKIDDIFLVDTNIWLWQTYPNATVNADPTRLAQINAYLNYIGQALSAGSVLTYSGLSFAELASVIERIEWSIYKNANGFIPLKEYRHNLGPERARTVSAVQVSWSQVQSLAVPVDVRVDDTTITSALQRFQSQCLDGYDLLLLEAISQADPGQVKVITDDADYVTSSGIQVFTCNSTALASASTQGKQIVR